MTTISSFLHQHNQQVCGVYRVTGGRSTVWNSQYNRLSTRLTIGDYTGQANLLLSFDAPLLPLNTEDIIQAQVQPKPMPFGIGGVLVSAEILKAEDLTNLPMTLPLSSCPTAARGALVDLVKLWPWFSEPALRKCLTSALNRHYHGFLNAQGGWRYHHEYPGGLLVHSVSTAQESLNQARRAYPHDPSRVQIVLAAALLHDFGKARQIIRGTQNPVLKLIPHEYLSLQMISEELETLGRAWPQGGELLTSILYWLSRPLTERPRGHDVELVHDADVIDVKADRLHRYARPLAIPPPRPGGQP